MLPATKNRQSAPPVLWPPRRRWMALGWLVRRRSGCGPLCRLEAVDAAASSSSRLSAIACLALCQPRGGSPTSRPRSRLMSGMWDEICWEMSEPLAFVPESPSTLKVKAFPHQYSNDTTLQYQRRLPNAAMVWPIGATSTRRRTA